MSVILIILGVGLFFVGMATTAAFLVLRLQASNNGEPTAPITGYLLYALGVFLIVWSAYCLIRLESAYGWWYLFNPLFAIGLFCGAVWAIKFGKDADKRHYENMQSRAGAKTAHEIYERAEAARRHAQADADRRHWLETERARAEAEHLATQRAAAETQRQELESRRRLVPVAEQNGVAVDDFTAINSRKFMTEIDLSAHRVRSEIDLSLKQQEAHGALDAADRVDHYQIVAQLEDELEKLYEKRRDVEKNEKDEVLRDKKIGRLNTRIQQLEADIDGRQNRLLSGRNGQTPRRLT